MVQACYPSSIHHRPMEKLWLTKFFSSQGSGGGSSGRVAALCPADRRSIPLGAGLFSLSINQLGALNQVPRGGRVLTDYPKNRLSSAA